MLSRALGCLYGQVIGDAFGARYECKTTKKVSEQMKKDANADGFIPVLSGHHNFKPGQFTDDTEMALSLADSLCNCGKFDEVDIACAYVHWAQTLPKTMGAATRAALGRNIHVTIGSDWRSRLTSDEKNLVYYSVKVNAFKCNQNSLSNGILMRISPLAIAMHGAPDKLLKSYCQRETNLTHTDPIAIEAVYVYVCAIRSLLHGKTVEEVYEEAVGKAKTELVKSFLEAAKQRPHPVKLVDGRAIMSDGLFQGFLGVALQGAFYELLHANTFYEGITNTVMRGGDTDTNGCITGSLLGARFGVDDIPLQWRSVVKEAPPRSNFTTVDFKKPDFIVENLLNVSGNSENQKS